jgi:hypothetical protein
MENARFGYRVRDSYAAVESPRKIVVAGRLEVNKIKVQMTKGKVSAGDGYMPTASSIISSNDWKGQVIKMLLPQDAA